MAQFQPFLHEEYQSLHIDGLKNEVIHPALYAVAHHTGIGLVQETYYYTVLVYLAKNPDKITHDRPGHIQFDYDKRKGIITESGNGGCHVRLVKYGITAFYKEFFLKIPGHLGFIYQEK